MARLQEMNDRLQEEIKKDPKSDKVYSMLLELSYEFLRRKKVISNNPGMLREVSNIMAEEVYMHTINKGKEVYFFPAYMGCWYINCINKYHKWNSSERIDVSANPHLKEAIMEMCSTKSESSIDREKFDMEFIDTIPDIIDEVLDKTTIAPYTREYLNVKLSLIYSLSMDNNLTLNSISKDRKDYVSLVFNCVLNKIKTNAQYNVDVDALGNLSLAQLYALETYAEKNDYDEFGTYQ